MAGPIITLSIASSSSERPIICLFSRTVKIAASFRTFSRSAPEKPGVLLARASRSTSSASFLLRACTARIALRPFKSGKETVICLSNRPGLKSAGSKTSGRLVAAITTIPELSDIPSISTSSWFKVCSLSSWPPPIPAPRCLPTASISSIKIIQGAVFLALANISLTRDAPTPTNISTKSEPEIE